MRHHQRNGPLSHPIAAGFRLCTALLALTALASSPLQGQATTPLPIAVVRADADGDGRPDLMGDTVHVAGRATTGATALDRRQTRLFVQDGTGGILLFSFDPVPGVQRADSVEARGVVEQYHGLTQLRLLDHRVVAAPARHPEPRPLDGAAPLEPLEGSLVSVRGTVQGSGSNEGGPYLLLAAGEPEGQLVTVFVSRTHARPPNLQRYTVGDRVEVTGPLGQFDVSPPFASFYQIYPRSPADVIPTAMPRRSLYRMLWIGGALLALAAGVLLLLRLKLRHHRRRLAESEHSHRISREQLGVLLDHLPVGLWTVDPELRFTWIRGGSGLLLVDTDALVGTTIQEIFATEDPASPSLSAYRAALSGTPTHFEDRWADRWWSIRLEPLRNDEGEVTGVLGVGLDVTGHKEAESRLEEHRTHFQTLFDEAPEGIAVVDREDRVLQVNPEFRRMFGYGSAEAVGRPINELITLPGGEDEATEVTHRVSRGERVELEAVRRRKDGTPITVSILATPVEVGGETRVYAIYRDVTQQKTLEAQLLHAQRLEAVGQLAGGVAHDFNNILTVILGHTRVLLDELEGDATIRPDLEQIRKAAERAAKLTQQLLTFSRRDTVSLRPLDLNTEIRQLQEFLRRLVEEHVEVHLELATGLPRVDADPGQLHQVIMNLVINARDAMPGGGRVTIATRRQPRPPDDTRVPPAGGAPPDELVVLEVRDEGEGMSPEWQARIFEPFFTTKEPGKGTGLGLSTVYGIVERAGGSIQVESAPGQGTTVRVCLPPSQGRAVDPPTDEQVAASAVPGAARACVLLVDDDPGVRQVTAKILRRAGFRVVVKSSGREALEYCGKAAVHPDLVLSDVVMPGMSGFELVARLRASHPTVDVLLMTGYAQPRDRVEGVEILSKPFDAATLVRKVRERLFPP